MSFAMEINTDGNITNDGTWNMAWNAENVVHHEDSERMKEVEAGKGREYFLKCEGGFYAIY
jgi:hypothetical protein